MPAPICNKCIYFYLTYDYAKPYGCKAMGFKSATRPSLVVYANSSMHCQLFTPKKKNHDPSSNSGKRYI